ncbi:hypothetical protein ACFLZC_01985 [Patescibacteria group bacterium]
MINTMTDAQKIFSILITLSFLGFVLYSNGVIPSINFYQAKPVTQTASVLDAVETIDYVGSLEREGLTIPEYELIIRNLEAKIEKLESLSSDVKEITITKEVPVEKVVYKEVVREVVKETVCDPTIPIISSVEFVPGINPTSIKWKTDELTKSKIFISGGDIVDKIELPSVFPVAKGHRVAVDGLQLKTRYYYEIQATTIERGKEKGSAVKQGSFFVTPDIEEE